MKNIICDACGTENLKDDKHRYWSYVKEEIVPDEDWDSDNTLDLCQPCYTRITRAGLLELSKIRVENSLPEELPNENVS